MKNITYFLGIYGDLQKYQGHTCSFFKRICVQYLVWVRNGNSAQRIPH